MVLKHTLKSDFLNRDGFLKQGFNYVIPISANGKLTSKILQCLFDPDSQACVRIYVYVTEAADGSIYSTFRTFTSFNAAKRMKMIGTFEQ